MVLVQLTDGRGQEHCATCSPSGHFGASAWSKPQHAQHNTACRAQRSAHVGVHQVVQRLGGLGVLARQHHEAAQGGGGMFWM